MEMMVTSIFSFLFFAIWIGLGIYVLLLMTRLTRAAERIAVALERTPPKTI